MIITAFDHVGIRVIDRARALAPHRNLGFVVDEPCSNDRVAEIVAPSGARLNLIFDGEPTPERNSILRDEPRKWPGYTHAASVVVKLDDVLAFARRTGVQVTGGPVYWGRHTTCFVRDPDGNVLAFDELKTGAS